MQIRGHHLSMASSTRPRPQEDEEFKLSHKKAHYAADFEPPKPPLTRLDLRDPLVRKKGGGFTLPDQKWFDNVDASGRFQRRGYDEGLTFVRGLQITWLELERIEDFIVNNLYTKTGGVLPGGLPERLIHLEPDTSDTLIRIEYLIDIIKKKFRFNEVPTHSFDFQIHQLINNALSHIRWTDNSAAQRSGKILEFYYSLTRII